MNDRHTNCWCDPDVRRCSAFDCPRAAVAAEKEKASREMRERYDRAIQACMKEKP